MSPCLSSSDGSPLSNSNHVGDSTICLLYKALLIEEFASNTLVLHLESHELGVDM